MEQNTAHITSGGPRTALSADTTSTDHHSSAPSAIKALIFRLIGLIGGMFGGLLGIGGGSAIAPLLLIVGTWRPAEVSGTTLATVLMISIVGSGAYASLGYLNLGLAWPIAIGSVVGSILGAVMAKRLSMRIMIGMFLVILPYFAVKEVWPSLAAPEIATSTASLVALGTGTGFLSGLLGISGASLVVPSLVGFFLIEHHAAQGIAMSVALADSIAGTATHARAGNIHYRVLLYMAVPAIVAAVAGAFLSYSLSSSVLGKLFGLFMITIWAIMMVRWLKDYFGNRVKSPSQHSVLAEQTGGYRPHTGIVEATVQGELNRGRIMSSLTMKIARWKGEP